MCSIGGFISSRPLAAETAKRLCGALIFYGAQRGQQSAGIYINNRLYKRAVHPANFIYDDGFDELFDMDPSCALVHTRQPTSGGTGDEQAHPFWIGNTVTVHNGGIMNCKELREKWSLTKPSGVDSELMTSALDAYGIEKLPEIVKDLRGCAAVAALHHGELYLMRDGNPLEYYEVKLSNYDDTTTNLFVFGSTMGQVKDSIAHCWLIRDFGVTTTLPQEKIFKCSAAGVLTERGTFSTASYSYVAGSSGGATQFPTRRGTIIPTTGTTRPNPNLFLNGDTVTVLGEELSLQAVATILEATEEEIPPPTTTNGYGFRNLPNNGGVVYNHKFSAAQHLKYDPTWAWVKRLLDEPPVGKKALKRRMRKLRNRNQPKQPSTS